MTFYPQGAGSEEQGAEFAPILSNHIFPQQLVRLREANRQQTVMQKLSRETAKFHEDSARRYGVNTPKGLAHFRTARAYREANSKLLEFFENGGEIGELDPKVVVSCNKEAVAFHKKMAEKHGLDTDEGHAHIAMLEHHLDIINAAKKQGKSLAQPKEAAPGAKGRKVPFGGVPKKSEMKNPDIRQNWKPLVKLQQQKAAASGKGSGYVASRYDSSHPEGFKKKYESGRRLPK